MRNVGHMKSVARFLSVAFLYSVAAVSVGHAVPLTTSMHQGPVVQVDWQEPPSLPPRFRNHCATDVLSGRPYCSDHCGFNYQVYYCSAQSFGCCRPGFGYCDWGGQLRCHP
jgi:hypothetical protein